MPNRRETTITNELVNILRNMRHGWELETEVNAFIEDNSELDALVTERGREPVGIEAKVRHNHQRQKPHQTVGNKTPL